MIVEIPILYRTNYRTSERRYIKINPAYVTVIDPYYSDGYSGPELVEDKCILFVRGLETPYVVLMGPDELVDLIEKS